MKTLWRSKVRITDDYDPVTQPIVATRHELRLYRIGSCIELEICKVARANAKWFELSGHTIGWDWRLKFGRHTIEYDCAQYKILNIGPFWLCSYDEAKE